MQAVRIIEIPKCKMVSSGAGFFGEEKFETFGRWFSSLPAGVYPKDFLCEDEAGLCWLYLYDDGMEIPDGFAVVDFEGGIYAVATDIDRKTDMDAMNTEVDKFLAENGLERDDRRCAMGHIITSPKLQKMLSYAQMDYYTPVRAKK